MRKQTGVFSLPTSLIITLIAMTLTGCWSKYELTERGFVMGVALDETKDGKIEMLTQIYRPASVETGKSATTQKSSVSIRTHDDTVMEAVRDIPIHLGRKAQWSHTRVIIVGEKLARSQDLSKTLDLFYRDHEPRSSVKLLISKGPAYKLLEKQPLIEQTTAQQILRTEEFSFLNAAKTMDSTLLSLLLQRESAHPDAILSYVYNNSNPKETLSTAGLALIKEGKLKKIMPPDKVEGLLMLRNDYHSGVLEIPCSGMKGEKETAEVLSLRTAMKTKVQNGKPQVSFKIKGDLAITEMKCTSIVSFKDEQKFVEKFSAAILRQTAGTLKFLQKNKLEVIGIGNQLYRQSPKEWQKLQQNWDEQFARLPIEVKAEFRLVTGGTINSKPVS
ncbi:spore germination protein KC [Paenibacillus algorifonticola]|uniref:Spore germination protein KC n=1 Tax=Paenibacillus algorifonticola TaxID=684063 RepID=A0A1I2C111_9BACL|nr:Ger(x)C family spore germination protein [Paenibacillus algorifonticola]SFE61250.1 spore germination protein KC [Paenibacillus algorifonticola]